MANAARGQFEILDKAVAERFWELYNRPFIYRQDVDQWRTLYNQLERFAESNSGDSWIARGWAEEKPRYANSVANLMSKVRVANPTNYDTTIKVKGCNGCDCGKTNIPVLPYTPMNIPPGSGGTLVPGRGGTMLSLGDSIRNSYSPGALPFFDEPDTLPKQIAKDATTGIIVAVVIAIVLWGFHALKKRAN